MDKFNQFYVTMMKESINAKRPENDAEKIAYLVQHLPMISPANRDKSSNELAKMAIRLIGKGMFDTIYDAHERKTLVGGGQIEDTTLPGGTPTEEDIGAVPEAQRHMDRRRQAETSGYEDVE